MNNEEAYIASFDEYLRLGEPSKQESAVNLKNRYLHIHATKEWGSQPNLEAENGGVKANSGGKEVVSGGVNGGVNTEELLLKIIAENPGCNTPTITY